ncbi:MAG: hypothetical protein M3R67_12680 [Acidobacteriota bacterium]|nr:hypothetical protein [Acidobacteriota bacterium]
MPNIKGSLDFFFGWSTAVDGSGGYCNGGKGGGRPVEALVAPAGPVFLGNTDGEVATVALKSGGGLLTGLSPN